MDTFCNSSSVRKRDWEERPSSDIAPSSSTLQDGRIVPSQLCEIIARRGVDDVGAYLEPTLRRFMPDPFSLPGMEDAVIAMARAISSCKKICIYGDYDVDGATSTALLTRYLRQVGITDSIFYIPQRLTEGYGPNIPAVGTLADCGVEFLVFADSGTTAFEAVAAARARGMEVVILDHHQPLADGTLPDADVVNPKRMDADGSVSYLCTAGLAFLFLVGLNRYLRGNGFFTARGIVEPKLGEMIDLVTLGTVCDVVPLKGLNRAMVKLGIAGGARNPGILALLAILNRQATSDAEARGKKGREVTFVERSCGFLIGPPINAGGRLSDTMLGSRLLTTDDPDEAAELAGLLHGLNQERRIVEKVIVEAATERVLSDGHPGKVIVIHDEEWHPGVVGIAASKLVKAFDRPAVIVGRGGKGSGRSIKGFSIGRSFIEAHAIGLLMKGGGHDAAGGLTMDPARIEELRKFLDASAASFSMPPLKIDMILLLDALKMETVAAAGIMAPFGMGNAMPRLALTGGVLRSISVLQGIYIKGALVGDRSQVDIYFRGAGTPLGDALLQAKGRRVDIMGTVSLNTFGGTTRIQVEPRDARIGAIADDGRVIF